MPFHVNTAFGRAIALSVATAFSSVPALANDSALPPHATQKMVLHTALGEALREAGLSDKDITKTRAVILENMFRFSRTYIRPAEMEDIETAVVEGIKERISSRPKKIEDAKTKLTEAEQNLTKLKQEYIGLQRSDSSDQNALIDLGDKIIEAEFELTVAKRRLKFAEKYQKISPEILAYAGLNHAFQGFDPHSAYMGPGHPGVSHDVGGPGPKGGIGIAVATDGRSKYLLDEGIRVKATLSEQDESPARKAGLKRGDLITHIDDKAIAGLRLDEVIKEKLKGEPGTDVVLKVKREGADEALTITVKRAALKLNNVTYRIVGGNVGYIDIDTFVDPKMTEKVVKAIKSIQEKLGGVDKVAGYVISLRDNGGGLLDQSVALINEVVDAGGELDRTYGAQIPEDVLRRNTVVSTRSRKGLDDRFLTKPGDVTGGKKITVLINGGSASASEIVSGGLQDLKRAKVAGIRSFGKGSVQGIGPAPRGTGRLKITQGLYYYGPGDEQGPYGESPQHVGVEPDLHITFMKKSKLKEAGLDNTIARTDTVGPVSRATQTCDKADGEFDLSQADQSLIDPRTGEYDFALACVVADIKGKTLSGGVQVKLIMEPAIK